MECRVCRTPNAASPPVSVASLFRIPASFPPERTCSCTRFTASCCLSSQKLLRPPTSPRTTCCVPLLGVPPTHAAPRRLRAFAHAVPFIRDILPPKPFPRLTPPYPKWRGRLPPGTSSGSALAPRCSVPTACCPLGSLSPPPCPGCMAPHPASPPLAAAPGWGSVEALHSQWQPWGMAPASRKAGCPGRASGSTRGPPEAIIPLSRVANSRQVGCVVLILILKAQSLLMSHRFLASINSGKPPLTRLDVSNSPIR